MGSAFGAVDVSYTAFWHFPNYKNPQTKEILPLIYRKSTEMRPKFGQFIYSEGVYYNVLCGFLKTIDQQWAEDRLFLRDFYFLSLENTVLVVAVAI